MRNFWIVLGLLTLLSAWMVWPSEVSDDPTPRDATPRPMVAPGIDPLVVPTTEGASNDAPDAPVAAAATDGSEASEVSEGSSEPESPVAAAASGGPGRSDDSSPPPSSAESAASAESNAADSSETIGRLGLGLDREIPDATIVEGAIVRTEDGTLRADDRYEIAGAGTKEDPYRISWELLVSAGEGYRPRVGDRGMPQRVALLDGAWVAIEGYIAFPMLVGTATEGLVMLNRWDGCCIGVPPSPYDAIEVKLVDPVVRTTMHAIDYGTVTGKLSVSPYLVENWLVGLYLMDDATMQIDL